MSSSERLHFGAVLRQFRLAAGLTQATLAERAGLSERAVNDLERDPHRVPRLETIALLADALGLSPDDRARLLQSARPEAVHTPRRPIASSPASRSRPLPTAPNAFVARAREVAALCTLLQDPDVRLLTLTGPGGIGKTRLALRVAAVLEATFADGVCFVPLESLTDALLLLPTIAAALGIPESLPRPPAHHLTELLRARTMLLVLDNFEQVTSAAIEVERLLAACPGLTILVTSRAPLRLAREREFAVPPLAAPGPSAWPTHAEALGYDAVAFLVQCARACVPNFSLTDANTRSVADICIRLDGMPLAIQLAAARFKLLPPAALLARLDQQLALLTGGPQDAPERQRTMRATLDWSFHLLTLPQQALLRRLGVFMGGWTLDAAEEICVGEGVERAAVLDLLGDLVDQSLVVVEEQDGATRYHLLETIREYALEKRRAANEDVMLRDRHLVWYLRLAEHLDAQGWVMSPPAPVRRQLLAEADNFRAALVWSRREPSGQLELQLAGALHKFWAWSITEGRQALQHALDRADPAVDSPARARVLIAAAGLAAMHTDAAEAARLAADAIASATELGDDRDLARAMLVDMRNLMGAPPGDTDQRNARWDEIVRLARNTGDPRALVEILWFRGDMELEHGEFASARRYLEECVTVSRQINDAVMLAYPIIGLARIACAEGDITRARTLAEQGVALRREEPSPWSIAIALTSQGEVERFAENGDRAAELFAEALGIFREMGAEAGIAWTLHNLGHIALRAGETGAAVPLFAEALAIRSRHRYAHGVASELAAIAGLRILAREYERAARLMGAAETLLAQAQSVLAPADENVFARDRAIICAQMGDSAFTAACDAGHALPLDEAIAEALGGTPIANTTAKQ